MSTHPYLRAYMAGITFPTIVTLLGLLVFTVLRHLLLWSVPMEQLIIFPMVLVPTLWGIWNVLYVATGFKGRWSLGMHGAILPFLLLPAGYFLQRAIGVFLWTMPMIIIGFPVVVVVYYFLWKKAVGFLNELVGVA